MKRKLFGTDGIRGIPNKDPLTIETILELGKAISYIFSGEANTIVIGKDTRSSCSMIESALAAGLTSMGHNVLSAGILPTPAISFITNDLRADAGIVISASHNLYTDNGIKIFDKFGFKLSDILESKIEELMFSNKLFTKSPENIGTVKELPDAMLRYLVFAKETFPKNLSLKGFKIVLDCANGAAYKVAQSVFKELGADIISVGVEPNGININANCGALYPKNIKNLVLENKANLGICLDGDADRVILVDEQGNILDGDYIMAIIAIDMKAKNILNKNTIVTTPMSNFGLHKVMEKHDIKIVEADVGDRYVVNTLKENKYNFGGEQSGHIIFLDKTTTGDGIIAALQVLSIMLEKHKPLSSLVSVMEKYPQVLKNVKVKEKIPFEEIPDFHKKLEKIKLELKDKGRVFVRYSGTESIARIMIEAKAGFFNIEKMTEDLAKYLL